MRIFVKLTGSELRLFLREPMAAFFGIAFPVVLVVILGSIPAFRVPSPDLGGLRVIDLYVPIAVALIIAMLGLQAAPAVLATYREKGVLRRLATTPARPAALLGAQLAMSVLIAVVSAALVLLVGRYVFGVPFPARFPAFALSFLLGMAAVLAVGLLIAASAPSGKAANAAGTFLFFPLMFFAGLWTPREVMPAVIQRIGDFTPLGAAERAMHEAATGSWPALIAVAVMTGYVVVFGLAAARLFRWE
ncbi:MAG TPA: ABC transporter permease [Actinoplanes sp.]|nr:ABC transporter permease [Actinoplanes sp.]